MEDVKLVVVGDGAVGKTCMFISYTSNQFPKEYIPTVFENYRKNTMIDDRRIALNLWDTAGQESYENLRPMSYPKTSVFLVAFSVNSRTTFRNVQAVWMPELSRYMDAGTIERDVPIILVGTKGDLRGGDGDGGGGDDFVSEAEAQQLADTVGASKYMECSAMTQVGLEKVFQEAMRLALDHRENKKIKAQSGCGCALM